jgi:hypothetical protein
MFRRGEQGAKFEAGIARAPLRKLLSNMRSRHLYEACATGRNEKGHIVRGFVRDRATQALVYWVDLECKTCSCRKFQRDLLPCEHAYSLIKAYKLRTTKFIPDFYLTETYQTMYEEEFAPVEVLYFRGKENQCKAPDLVIKTGRKKTKRIPSKGEARGKAAWNACRKCKAKKCKKGAACVLRKYGNQEIVELMDGGAEDNEDDEPSHEDGSSTPSSKASVQGFDLNVAAEE